MATSRSHAVALALAIAALLAVSACSSSPATSSGRVDVVTTTTQLTDFARVIGGDHVAVHGILKPNVDPHDYEPSPADIDQLAEARVIVKNGVGLEAWFDDTIEAADPRAAIVDASKGVKLRRAHPGGAPDPHIWQDPRNAEIMVANIERALVRADPVHRADYERNLARYRDQLDRLDREIAARIGSLPNKELVTDHDAFGYYIDRYGLVFEGSIVPSFDTSAQLSAADVQDLVARIRATGTKAIFSEHSLPPKTAEAIGREAKVEVVAGAGSLYGDTLGPPGSDGDTYLKVQRHNTAEIVDHLR